MVKTHRAECFIQFSEWNQLLDIIIKSMEEFTVQTNFLAVVAVGIAGTTAHSFKT